MIWIAIIFFVLLVMGIPIAFVLGLTSLLYILGSGTIAPKIVAMRMYGGIDEFVLLAIPFFILAGQLMTKSGITRDLVELSNLIIGRIRGSLAHINVLASIFFAGLTGAATSDAAALGSILIPAMEKEGYTPEYSGAVTAVSSVIGPIIPPSIVVVIYSSVTGESVAALFLGGFIPGVTIGLALMGLVYVYAVRENHPYRKEPVPRKDAIAIITKSSVGLMVPIVILGGILSGIFTPTEAAAVACAYGLFVGVLLFRTLNWSNIRECFIETVKTSAMVLIIIAGARIFGLILSIERIPDQVAGQLLNITENRILILLIFNVFLLVMGMLMEPGSNVIILAPILAPIAATVGIDPLHFALVMIVNLNIGMVTPPVGISLFVVSSIAKRPFERIAMKALPFIAVEIGMLLLITYIPTITLILPKLFGFH
ncbi:MAG: TRAP transporter large permease [Deltaproteobacteria bacterium]|nr:TRAP transporter large permease [Deltaproteobacteria bacterium]